MCIHPSEPEIVDLFVVDILSCCLLDASVFDVVTFTYYFLTEHEVITREISVTERNRLNKLFIIWLFMEIKIKKRKEKKTATHWTACSSFPGK